MKKIVDAVKIIQNKPPARYKAPSVDEDYDDNFYTGDDYSDEDEGTSAPIKTVPWIKYPMAKVEDPYSKLLNGYTNENQDINVNIYKTLLKICNSYYSFCIIKFSDQTIDS